MSELVKKIVLNKMEVLKSQVLSIAPKTKSQDIEALFLNFSAELSEINFAKLFHLRKLDGTTVLLNSLEEVAKILEISPHTLTCYLSQGAGTTVVKNQTVSTKEFLLPGPDIRSGNKKCFWFRDRKTGQVTKSENVEEIAKLCGLASRTLYSYLSTGKGSSQTKTGYVSTHPIQALSAYDAWEEDYYEKHRIWPNQAENPHHFTGRY